MRTVLKQDARAAFRSTFGLNFTILALGKAISVPSVTKWDTITTPKMEQYQLFG
jgi:hypothetical protein